VLLLPLWISIPLMLPELQIGMGLMAHYHHPLQNVIVS
jgi:hypothetical protein